MVTKSSGGKITGLLALTVEAQEALEIGDFVHLVGDYEVEKADGTLPILGCVSVTNKGRVSNVMGTSVGNAVVPGAVTVEARGLMVRTVVAGGTIAAGEAVGVGAAGAILPAGVGVSNIGIALTGGDEDDEIDVLVL